MLSTTSPFAAHYVSISSFTRQPHWARLLSLHVLPKPLSGSLGIVRCRACLLPYGLPNLIRLRPATVHYHDRTGPISSPSTGSLGRPDRSSRPTAFGLHFFCHQPTPGPLPGSPGFVCACPARDEPGPLRPRAALSHFHVSACSMPSPPTGSLGTNNSSFPVLSLTSDPFSLGPCHSVPRRPLR
jgi:hypothetical protein